MWDRAGRCKKHQPPKSSNPPDLALKVISPGCRDHTGEGECLLPEFLPLSCLKVLALSLSSAEGVFSVCQRRRRGHYPLVSVMITLSQWLAPSELRVLGVGFCLSSVTVVLFDTEEKVRNPKLIITHFPLQ